VRRRPAIDVRNHTVEFTTAYTIYRKAVGAAPATALNADMGISHSHTKREAT
jgi:CRISPR/Cas system-associated endonuclease Cas1